MPEPIDESAAVVAWLRAEVAEWLPLNPHTDLGLSARSGAALLARLDAVTAERDRLRAALRETRELWELAAPQLDAMDKRYFVVPFMGLHKPIARIDAALAPAE